MRARAPTPPLASPVPAGARSAVPSGGRPLRPLAASAAVPTATLAATLATTLVATLALLSCPRALAGQQPDPAPDSAGAAGDHRERAVGGLAPDTVPRTPPDTVRLRDLVVTAYRVPLPRDRHPAAVTVIDREEIEASGAEHVLELLRTVSGLQVAQAGSFGMVASLFTRGGESNFTKVLVDGVAVNAPGGDFDFSTLTTDNVERIEIVRGPTSVVHGSDAVSGVVQIFTRKGVGPPRFEAGLEGGTFGTLDWVGSLSGGTETVRYSASLSRFLSDGTFDLNDDFRNTVASGAVELRPDPRTRVSLTARFSDNESHFPTDDAGRPVDANQFTFGDDLVLGLEASRFLTERLEAVVQTGWHRVEGGFDDGPDEPADSLGFFGFQSRFTRTRIQAGARLNLHLDDRTVVTVGGEVEEEDEENASESLSEFGTSEGRTDVNRTNGAAFAQLLLSPVPSLTLSAGARLDENEAFGTFDTYRLGASWSLPTGTRLRAGYGTAFKEPTFVENFSTGFAVGNPELDPERSESWEVGMEQELAGGALVLRTTYFDQDFEDLIQFTASQPGSGDPSFFNVARASSRGVEAQVEWRLPAAFRLGTGYSWLDTEVEDAGFQTGPDAAFAEGQELLRRAIHAGSLTLDRPLPGEGTVRLHARFVGDREDLSFETFPARRVELDAYARLDLALRLPELPLPGLSLPGRDGERSTVGVAPTLRIENLLDDAHEQVVGFPARGRTVIAGGQVVF